MNDKETRVLVVESVRREGVRKTEGLKPFFFVFYWSTVPRVEGACEGGEGAADGRGGIHNPHEGRIYGGGGGER